MFLFLLIRVVTWKNLVFFSPSSSQLTLDLISHSSRSFSRVALYSSLSCFSKLTRKGEGETHIFLWIPESLASMVLFLLNMFPKVSSFQIFERCLKQRVASFKLSFHSLQDFLTSSGKEGCDSHMTSNLKGRGILYVALELKDTSRGRWSECIRGRCWTSAFGKSYLQGGFATARSNLS